MILTPAQKEIASDLHRFRVVNCGRRFGKTTLAIYEMLAKAVAQSDRQVAYIATTYQQSRDIAWQELKRAVGDQVVNINESRLEIEVKTIDEGSSRIVLRGWESVETLRGQRFDFLVLDEVASMRHFWVNWHEVLRPTLTDTKGEVLFISTPKGFNHFYDLYNLQDTDKDYKSFHYTTYNNTHIPVEEIDKASEELTEDSFAQEYMADFRKQEGLVYKEFSRDRHLFDKEIERANDYIAGVDFGFTNPSAVLGIKEDHDGRFWVVSEWYQSGRTNEEVADHVLSYQFNKVYPDPASPEAIKVMQEKHIPVREVSKGKDSIQTGINKIRELFKQNRLMIHKDCVNLISELETYHYPEAKGENIPELPEKVNDHALDALRYAIMSHKKGIDTQTLHQRKMKAFHTKKKNLVNYAR